MLKKVVIIELDLLNNNSIEGILFVIQNIFIVLKLMNHDIGDVGQPHTFRKLKNSCQNFGEVGSAITIDNDSTYSS